MAQIDVVVWGVIVDHERLRARPYPAAKGCAYDHAARRKTVASTQARGSAINEAMHALSLYLDTSVLGGYFDAEFMADTRALWKLREQGRYRFISSVVVDQEIARAPERVRALLKTSIEPDDMLALSAEALDLTRRYMAQKVVPADYEDDALHVAVCTVARIEYLVSWNFKHLTNVRRESGFNAVNLLQGYPSLRIVAPTFLIHGHEQEKDL